MPPSTPLYHHPSVLLRPTCHFLRPARPTCSSTRSYSLASRRAIHRPKLSRKSKSLVFPQHSRSHNNANNYRHPPPHNPTRRLASSHAPPPPSSSSSSTAHQAISTTSPTPHPHKSPQTPQTTPPRHRPATNPDRGPTSTEDTQTDFTALNVLANTASPATSVDVCLDDGFILDSGLRVTDGDGVLLVGGQGFVWRPWMVGGGREGGGGRGGGEGGDGGRGIVTGSDLKRQDVGKKPSGGGGGGGGVVGRGTGGVVNSRGQFEIAEEAWAVLRAAWPKPDLLIIGTGAHIRPLSPQTRTTIQSLGLRLEVLDTRNAASQFNLLATERGPAEVCAAFVPVGFGV